jgi:hypothetical protein
VDGLSLARVTFTGVDAFTDLERLAALAVHRPWMEVAALVSEERAGEDPRYPSRTWRQRFLHAALPRRQRALHLCGAAVGDFLRDDERLLRDLDRVARVQLNFSAERIPSDWLEALPSHVRQWQDFAPDTEFVLQINPANARLPTLFSPPEHYWNVAFLADSSGGRGVVPAAWPAPVPGFRTAYAGGIAPGRIVSTLRALAEIAPPITGIDMETGVRTDDCFDLDKVEQVIAELEACCARSVDGTALRFVA